jgi:AraC-like DNA-binding protein
MSGTFSAVEELEETVRSVGWDIDYRQISIGRFATDFSVLNGTGTSLMSLNFNNHLHIRCESPEGFVGFLLPRPASGEVTMRGTTLSNGECVFFPARSEMDFVTRGGVGNETILVPEAEFRATIRALAPSETSSLSVPTSIYRADHLRCTPMRREISSVLRKGNLDAEVASNLLAEIFLWTTNAPPGLSEEQLSNARATAIAKRAQDFIENEYQNTIHMKDICAYTGVGIRTLQRAFAEYFQVTPFEYIKTRRLNEARHDLVTADPSVSSVTRIATRNGFFHLGRFSVEYRTYFGESPSKTLAARKY